MSHITHEQLADIAQNTLGDAGAATWPQATVEEWVVQALRDYGTHFSRIRALRIAVATTGTRSYELPEDFREMVNVLYPYDVSDPHQTETPLHRRDRRDPGFWDEDGYYDILSTRSADEDADLSVLYISEEPTAGEEIYIEYSTFYWDIPTGAPETDYIYVPYEHIPILVQFIVFLAAQERLATELQDPDRTLHLVNDLTEAVASAKKIYDDMIAAAKAGRSEGLVTPPWEMDAFDRIY
jgi:hypothetical protein